MSTPLATYLHDHLAGSKVAVDLLGVLREEYAGEPLAATAAQLLIEIEEDRAVLSTLVERVGSPAAGLVKEGMAWLGEQGTRLKLRTQVAGGVGTLELLETLALGILGKLSLWRALAQVDPRHPVVSGIDLRVLADRAQRQHATVEERRLAVARQLFNGAA